MGLFDSLSGMFGGGPMAINQDGQNFMAQPQQGSGGLLGLDMSGQKPLYDMGGQGSGLLGFGQPNNTMMNYGMRMAGMGQPQQGMFGQQPQQQQQQMPMQWPQMPQQQPQQQQQQPQYHPFMPPGGFNPHKLY